jgi:hypothetical protein
MYRYKYNVVRSRSFWKRKPMYSKVNRAKMTSAFQFPRMRLGMQSVKTAGLNLTRAARGFLARKKLKWTAKRAVGRARVAQLKWRRAYLRRHGRAV